VTPRPVRQRRGPLPTPPSVEPTVYKKWLHDLPDEDREAVDRFCKSHRLDYQEVCGGIGPLHIPYPPYMRVAYPAPHESLFASVEAWNNSLSPLQRKYIDRECGGENFFSSDLCGDNTPLVIAFDSEPITFTAGVPFDAPTPTTPWLALDRNGNGRIDGAAELFGSDTVLADGTHAPNGFIALAELDANGDGLIDASDPAFASLQLWGTDLTPAASRIMSISLANHIERRCDARCNCEGERASIVWRDARGTHHDGSVVDVYLPRR
jgi:hypothetical protein